MVKFLTHKNIIAGLVCRSDYISLMITLVLSVFRCLQADLDLTLASSTRLVLVRKIFFSSSDGHHGRNVWFAIICAIFGRLSIPNVANGPTAQSAINDILSPGTQIEPGRHKKPWEQGAGSIETLVQLLREKVLCLWTVSFREWHLHWWARLDNSNMIQADWAEPTWSEKQFKSSTLLV